MCKYKYKVLSKTYFLSLLIVFFTSNYFLFSGPNEDLITGIEKSNIKEVKSALDKGADINTIDSNGNTALIFAVKEEKSIELISFLIEKGAKVNMTDEESWTPLFYAVEQSNFDLVKLLINNGADIKLKNIDKRNALMIASKKGSLEVVKYLLDKGANCNEVDKKGINSLMIALSYNNIEVIKFLINITDNINKKSKDGKNGLMIAVRNNNFELVKLLINKGAEINSKDSSEYSGQSLLMMASSEGNLEICKLLIENHADINAVSNPVMSNWDKTALMFAIENKHFNIAKLLIDSGANINMKDNMGFTSLMIASYAGNLEIVKLLVNKEAKINEKNVLNETALNFAKDNNNFEIADYLISKGAKYSYDLSGTSNININNDESKISDGTNSESNNNEKKSKIKDRTIYSKIIYQNLDSISNNSDECLKLGKENYKIWEKIEHASFYIKEQLIKNRESFDSISNEFKISLEDLEEIYNNNKNTLYNGILNESGDFILKRIKKFYLTKSELYFQKCIYINPNSQEANYWLAVAYERKYGFIISDFFTNKINNKEIVSNTLKIINQYEKVLKISPDYKDEINILGPYSKLTAQWSSLALYYTLIGKSDSAKWAFKEGKKRFAFDESLLELCRNILVCCEKDAILFVNGDNDTFPMWYLQAIENFRSDVTVLNLSLANIPLYLKLYKYTPPFGGNNINFSFKDSELIEDENSEMCLKYEILDKVKIVEISNIKPDYLKKYNLTEEVQRTGKLKLSFSGIRSYPEYNLFTISDFAVIDIIKTYLSKKPLYFAFTVSNEDIDKSIKDMLITEGFVKRFCPVSQSNEEVNNFDLKINDKCINSLNNSKESYKNKLYELKFNTLGGSNVLKEESLKNYSFYQGLFLEYAYFLIHSQKDFEKGNDVILKMKKYIDFQKYPADYWYFYFIGESLKLNKKEESESFKFLTKECLSSCKKIISENETNKILNDELITQSNGPYTFSSKTYELLENYQEATKIYTDLINKKEVILKEGKYKISKEEFQESIKLNYFELERLKKESKK